MTSDEELIFSIDSNDLPDDSRGAEKCLKIREVKVCNNGVPATAYILMSKPEND